MSIEHVKAPAVSEAPAVSDAPSVVRRWPGHPRPWLLLRDGLQSAFAQPVATLTAAIVVATACVVVFLTTGQSAAAERAVVAHIDDVGTRLVVAYDTSGEAHISADSVGAASRLDVVTWAFGLGPARDVKNANLPTSSSVAMRPVVGDLPSSITLVAGREPRAGEAVVGVEAARDLGLGGVAGTVGAGVDQWPVVGVVEADGPLARLNTMVLLKSGADPGDEVRFVYALATSVQHVPALAEALPVSVVAQDPGSVIVDEPAGAIALRKVIAGELGRSARTLMLIVMSVGLVLISVTLTGAVAQRRRDYGRRRALGATRSAIVVTVLIQTGVAAISGACVGTGLGVGLLLRAGGAPTPSFTGGVSVLAVVVALLGAIPPALAAASRDPVRILRVP